MSFKHFLHQTQLNPSTESPAPTSDLLLTSETNSSSYTTHSTNICNLSSHDLMIIINIQIKIILIHQQINIKLKPKKLIILALNCCSVRSQSRRGLLQAIVKEHQADIVIGCESHLDDTYLTQEVFPRDYGVIRKDRNSSGGGVFLAIRNDLFFTEDPSFHGDTEMVWVKPRVNNTLKNSWSNYAWIN